MPLSADELHPLVSLTGTGRGSQKYTTSKPVYNTYIVVTKIDLVIYQGFIDDLITKQPKLH